MDGAEDNVDSVVGILEVFILVDLVGFAVGFSARVGVTEGIGVIAVVGMEFINGVKVGLE